MSVSYKDYYKILEVERTATTEEIDKSYKKLARKYHPDLNQGDSKAEEKFKEVNEAHEVLKDPQKRKLYDQLGPNWKDGQNFQGAPGFENFQFNFQGGQGGFGGGDFSDFFEMLFGQHGGFGGGVGLGDQGGQAVLGLLRRARLGLEQVAVGKTDVVNGNGHIIFFSPFLLRI